MREETRKRRSADPSAFVRQSDHKIHSAQDTSDYPEFSFSHMLEFSKLAVAFAVEMGGFAGKA